jgi:phosphonate transport system ATP-binding protein
MINGLELPTSGEVKVADRVVNRLNLREVRGDVGIIFQHYNLVSRLSVMTNALTGRLKYRSWVGSMLYLFRKSDMDHAFAALDRVGLLDRAWDRADRLSGGQQQRVGIARALAQQPRVLLADEPVASLDPVTSEEIMQLLREICDRDGITVIVNLHQVDLAKRFASRVIGLNAGQIVFDGHPNKLNQQTLDQIYHTKKEAHDEQQPAPLLAYA